ncbi:MAG TPA: hypothetical protein EYP41_04110 [Anaerolineae bacterium]|nr:hypothetical protein [Anaerolineae bacterium]HIP70402.1 hypothetical protein [Anaerolineae bacterium]
MAEAGWRGTDLGKQNNVIPRRLAPILTIFGARRAGDMSVLQRRDVFPPVPPLRLISELELLHLHLPAAYPTLRKTAVSPTNHRFDSF